MSFFHICIVSKVYPAHNKYSFFVILLPHYLRFLNRIAFNNPFALPFTRCVTLIDLKPICVGFFARFIKGVSTIFCKKVRGSFSPFGTPNIRCADPGLCFANMFAGKGSSFFDIVISLSLRSPYTDMWLT